MGMLVQILVMLGSRSFSKFSSPSQSINYLRKLLIVRHNFLISGLGEVSYRLKPFWDLREGVQSILKMRSV